MTAAGDSEAISANAKNCCQTVTGFLLFCSRLFRPSVLHLTSTRIDQVRHSKEGQIRMERLLQAEREKKWNSYVRKRVQEGKKRRLMKVLTGMVWVLLLTAVGLLSYGFYIEHSRLEGLRQSQIQEMRLAANQQEAQRNTLQEQIVRLTQDNDALRLQLETAREEVNTAEEDAREALAQTQPQPPKVVGPAYTALYPELYATSSRRETLAPEKTVYLTFDDGPSARTAEVLDILKEQDIKATFFVTGQTGELAQELMKRIVEEGHTIGIHTYTHDYKEIYASVEAYLADFNRIYNWVYEVTGVYPQIFRFPGGTVNSYNGKIYRELVAEMDRRGFVHYDWNAMCGDADGKPHTPEELARNSLAMVGAERAIVLMHDSAVRQTTVACLPAVIAGYRNAGYAFAPLTPEVKAITFDT